MASLLPEKNPHTHWIRSCVVSRAKLVMWLHCILHFPSIHQSVHSGICLTDSWQKLNWFVSIPAINRGKHDSLRCGCHFKDRVLLMTYKQQFWCAVWLWSYMAFFRNIPQTELLPLWRQDQASICIPTSTWGSISNICCLLNMRNVFY
jgi:hypothetical protein